MSDPTPETAGVVSICEAPETPLDLPKQVSFSASQIESASGESGCVRKWGFSKIAKIPKVEKPSAKLGTDAHLQAENWLQGGAIDFTRPSGEVICAGLHLLPSPNSRGVHIEVPFEFSSTRTRFRWVGRKDIEAEDTCVFPVDPENPEAELGGVPGVSDHKTTSGIAWAKTPDDLLYDVQANLYAYEQFQQNPGAPAVDLIWTYYQTKGAKRAKRTHLRMYREHASRMFDHIEDIASELAKHELACPDAPPNSPERIDYVNRLPPNPGACSAYGGCEFSHVCKLTLRERMRALVPPSEQKKDPENMSLILARLKERALPENTSPAINPPENALVGTVAAPSTPPPAITPLSVESRIEREDVKESGPETVLAALEGVETRASEELLVFTGEQHVVEAPAKRGPGRPRKNATPTAPVTIATAPETTAETSAAPGFVLYLDCYPLGLSGILTAASLVDDAQALIQRNTAERAGGALADYRFAQYGEGPGFLSSAVRELVEGPLFTKGVVRGVVLDSGMCEAPIIRSVLEAKACAVVVGRK